MSQQKTETSAGVASVSSTSVDLLATLDGYKFPIMSQNIPKMFGVQYSALVVVEDDYLWFRSRTGFVEPAMPREGALWDYAMAAEGPFIVEDVTTDPRFGAQSIGGFPIRFFASSPFHSPDGERIGLLCMADPEPSAFDSGKVETFAGLITWVDMELTSIQEIDRAAGVQRALLPKAVPDLAGYEVAGACVPARGVGGDFYDWYDIEGGAAFTLADVMGKGLGAGIIAATVRATIRSARRKKKPVVAIERAADVLANDLRGAGSFVTLFHARLRAEDGRLTFVDAGHGLAIIVEPEGTAYRLATSDFPLGAAFEGFGWHDERVQLVEGATLVCFSDGVLDLYDGTLDSVERVADIVRNASSVREIVDEIERLARRDEAPDDVTVIAIRRMNTEGAI